MRVLYFTLCKHKLPATVANHWCSDVGGESECLPLPMARAEACTNSVVILSRGVYCMHPRSSETVITWWVARGCLVGG